MNTDLQDKELYHRPFALLIRDTESTERICFSIAVERTAMEITHPFGIFSLDLQMAPDHQTSKIAELSYNADLNPRKASVDFSFLFCTTEKKKCFIGELCVSSEAGGE